MTQDHPKAALTPADIFLSVRTKRAGPIKGEARYGKHKDEICVISWHWAVTASSALGSEQASARRSYTELSVVKHIDHASTALMTALVGNDEVKEAKLSMCETRDGSQDVFVITLEDARITAVEHGLAPDGSHCETVRIAFRKVQAEYFPFEGNKLGPSPMFKDEILAK